jgi:hypothetical protein
MKAFLFTDGESPRITEITPEGSKVVYHGVEDFRNEIVFGDCCFICGAVRGSKPFNNEHIIPDWVLRRYNLYDESMTLPNGKVVSYRQYTVPCCQECNTILGTEVERPMSELFALPYSDFANALKNDELLYKKIFHWVCLLYLKTHLKDTNFVLNVDRRKDEGKIGEYHDWASIHHIYCMARQHYTEAKIQQEVYGSMVIVPCLSQEMNSHFDYMDSHAGKVVMVQLGEIIIYAVLDDSNIVQQMCANIIEKIKSPLSTFQAKQLFAHLNFVSINLDKKPTYQSTVERGYYEITSTIPEEVNILPKEEQHVSFGELLYTYVNRMVPEETPDYEKIMSEIRDEKRNYLFNEKGEFIDMRDYLPPQEGDGVIKPNDTSGKNR